MLLFSVSVRGWLSAWMFFGGANSIVMLIFPLFWTMFFLGGDAKVFQETTSGDSTSVLPPCRRKPASNVFQHGPGSQAKIFANIRLCLLAVFGQSCRT